MDCLNCHRPLAAAIRYCESRGAAAPLRCGSCGQACPPSARYCPQCGAPLAAGAAHATPGADATLPDPPPAVRANERAERRQLTVLFCDLVGSTEISTRLDPEDFRNAIGAYHRCVVGMVRAFDGYVALLLGDGAIVYFGFPHGHEDNAARAIRAALALIAEVGKLTVLDQALRVRIGVATGMVVVGDITDGDSETEG